MSAKRNLELSRPGEAGRNLELSRSGEAGRELRAAILMAALAGAVTVASPARADDVAPPPPTEPAKAETVVELRPPNAEPVPDVAPKPTKEPIGTQRFVGALVGATGFITTAVGGFLVLSGVNLYHDAKDRCGAGCTQTEVDDANRSRSRANGGGWVFLAGLALVGGGFALWFTAPRREPEKKSDVSLGVAPGVGSLAAVGTF